MVIFCVGLYHCSLRVRSKGDLVFALLACNAFSGLIVTILSSVRIRRQKTEDRMVSASLLVYYLCPLIKVHEFVTL